MKTLLPLIASRRVIVCVGAGGVGKTTVAAALGIAAAQRGKRVLCLTIDPARRLANSLGFGRMTTAEQWVQPERFAQAGLDVPGRLTMMMLDTKQTFDDLVTRHASSPAARDRILHNRIYQYVSTSLSGTQSYMAMEKLLEVKNDPRFDLVVLDTPPTSEALEFLDAPERLISALDSPAIRWFTSALDASRHFSLNFVAKSVAVVLRAIGKLTGQGFLENMAAFIADMNELFGGFRQRATQVANAFRGKDFAYVLVTTPAPVSIREAVNLADRLIEQSIHADAFVINRVHRAPHSQPTVDEIARSVQSHGLALGPEPALRLAQAVADEAKQARVDLEQLRELMSALEAKQAPLPRIRVEIPALPADVHDVKTLGGIAALLCH